MLFVFQDLCTVVPHWIRYKELIAILEASLQDIVDRWADGKVVSFCCYLEGGVCYFFFFFLQYQYNIKQTSHENKEKMSIRGLLVDPIPNSPNRNHKNCKQDSK